MITDRTTYIFIDYENVQDIDLRLISGKPVKIVLATGRNQTSLPKALVKQLVEYRDQIELIDNDHPGKNALDFVMVFEIARHALQEPKGFFQIVSKDKGFDALVRYLRANGTFSARCEDFSKIPALMDPVKMTAHERAARYAERLESGRGNRPARKVTMLSQIHAYFGKLIDQTTCEQVVEILIKTGRISITETGKISYSGSVLD